MLLPLPTVLRRYPLGTPEDIAQILAGDIIVLCNRESTTGAKTEYDLRHITRKDHTWSTEYIGSPTSVKIELQGSIIGAIWEDISSSNDKNGEVISVSGKPVTMIRAYVTTLSGGSSPTVTVRWVGK